MKDLVVLVVSMVCGFLMTFLASEAVTWHTESVSGVTTSGVSPEHVSGDAGLRLVEIEDKD